jgi:ubiquinone biosynthesis protein UbiJ
VARLEQEVRDQEYRAQEARRQAESYREGARASAQAEYAGFCEDIGALEEELANLTEKLHISQLWSARWKALAYKYRQAIEER